jgi:hypothetical protein
MHVKIPAIFPGEAPTRLLQGIALGALATVTIGFIWGGWVTGENARIMRAAAETSGRMSVLVPLCVTQFTAVDGAIARFKTTSVYYREGLVSEVVKNVASTSMDYSLARACVSGIDLELARAATKS